MATAEPGQGPLRVKILVYSLTGNTKHVADNIAAQLLQSPEIGAADVV